MGGTRSSYNKFLNFLEVLVTRAGIDNHPPERRNALYSAHSTRVAGVCYLLKAGLAETVIDTLCNWKSHQIKLYGKRVMLDPTLVEPFVFNNPVSLANSYTGLGSVVQGAGRKRKR